MRSLLWIAHKYSILKGATSPGVAFISAMLLLFVSAVVMGIIDHWQMSSTGNTKGGICMIKTMFYNFKAMAQGVIASLISAMLLPLEY